MYELLVFLHIASATLWVGGGVVVVAHQRRAYRSGGQLEAIKVIRELAWTDKRIFSPAPLIVVATGVGMVAVSDAWAFSQAWVYLTIAFIALEFIFGYRHLGAIESGQRDGDESPRLGAALRTYMRFAVVAAVMLFVVVALMVLKPGA